MLSLFRQLARYGAVFIEAQHQKWYVACEVKLRGTDYKSYVKANGEKLYWVLSDLIPLAKNEYQMLLKQAKEPKQPEFEYGTASGYKKYV